MMHVQWMQHIVDKDAIIIHNVFVINEKKSKTRVTFNHLHF